MYLPLPTLPLLWPQSVRRTLSPCAIRLQLSGVEVNFEDSESDGRGFIDVMVTVRCFGPTGVEMEALTAVSAALLTIYDMCKAIDRGMRMQTVELLKQERRQERPMGAGESN